MFECDATEVANQTRLRVAFEESAELTSQTAGLALQIRHVCKGDLIVSQDLLRIADATLQDGDSRFEVQENEGRRRHGEHEG
jgi:hypothetical protein